MVFFLGGPPSWGIYAFIHYNLVEEVTTQWGDCPQPNTSVLDASENCKYLPRLVCSSSFLLSGTPDENLKHWSSTLPPRTPPSTSCMFYFSPAEKVSDSTSSFGLIDLLLGKDYVFFHVFHYLHYFASVIVHG